MGEIGKFIEECIRKNPESFIEEYKGDKYSYKEFIEEIDSYINKIDINTYRRRKCLVVCRHNIEELKALIFSWKMDMIDGDRITVKALGTFEIGKTKSINLELIKCKVNAWKKTLTIEEPLDFLLSFVESADDVIELHKYIQNGGKVISKVETLKAMDNIEDIVKV